jgi:hypothetical protein
VERRREASDCRGKLRTGRGRCQGRSPRRYFSGQIYRWRQEVRAAAGFAPLLTAAPEAVERTAGPRCHGEPAIKLEFAGKIIVRIPRSIPVELAAVVVKALSRR